MKLAQFPNSQTLQPLPQQARADTSESVQRNATPADIQNVQNAPAPLQAPAPTIDVSATPQTFIPAQVGTAIPWIVLSVVILIAAGGMWLWRSFVE